jgi:hypothetical protein
MPIPAPVTLVTTGTMTAAQPLRLALPTEEGSFYILTTSVDARYRNFIHLADFNLSVVKIAAFGAPSVTFGMTDFTKPCFFAGGLPAGTRTGIVPYRGTGDGLAQTATATHRLLLSPAEATVNHTTGSGTFQLQLRGYPSAFTDTSVQTAVPLGTLSANLTLIGDRVEPAALSGLAGYTGTVTGQLVFTTGLALVFEVHNAAGEVTWGAVALDSAAF